MVHIRDAHLGDLPAMLAIYNQAVNTLVATFDLEEQSLQQREVWFHKHGGRYPLVGKLREVGYKFGEWHDVHFYQWIVDEVRGS